MDTIFPLYYYGNVAYWHHIFLTKEIQLGIGGTLPKKTYGNRTIIATANGLQTLSIPLIGGRGSRIEYSDLEISYTENWIAKHKMALQSAYAKSPYYEFYMPYFEGTLDQRYSKLFDLNKALFDEIKRLLKCKTTTDVVNNKPNLYYTPDMFDSHVEVYPQVFRYKYAFQPDLSILDLLFCMGPVAREYLS